MSAFYLRNFCVDYTLTSRINYEVFELFGFVITFQHRSYLLKLISNRRTCIRYSDMYFFSDAIIYDIVKICLIISIRLTSFIYKT